METDRYDKYSLHLACLLSESVGVYFRALPYRATVGFMLDREFECLLANCSTDWLHRTGSIEISRLTCSGASLYHLEPHPLELALKLLYHLSLRSGYDLFNIVVEEGWLKPFTRRFGLPFRVIGGPVTFPDGTRTVAATATLQELEEGMRRHSAEKFAWYQDPTGIELPPLD